MGLYLCIFNADEEIDGVEVGPYADFNGLRDYICRELEDDRRGSRFPRFMLHADSDGEWSVHELAELSAELKEIIRSMREKAPIPFVSKWQQDIAKSVGLTSSNAYESFVDVDGEFVVGRIEGLVELAIQNRSPILFQ